MTDTSFAAQCRHWVEEGSKLMESQLWAGDYYLAYYEPEANKKSDLVFGYQLDGDWMAKYDGLAGVFVSSRAAKALDKIKNTCVAINRYGAANFACPDATPAETGLKIVQSCLEGISVKYGYTWTQPNVVSGDTGKHIYGSDYYQNMMLWVVPAALDGHDIKKATAEGTLIDRVIRAGKKV